ncbi:hypothetical protein [Metabacillus sp. Hm71]|uniref:hypothetical protein n=1 Tax=Metabacillus sp. Hm71 TaxID=3450743 RepID=UPI003F4397C3
MMKKFLCILIFSFLLAACNNKVDEIESRIVEISGIEIVLDVTEYVSNTEETVGYDLRAAVEEDTEITSKDGEIIKLEELQPDQNVQVIFDEPTDLSNNETAFIKKITILE